MNKVFESPLQEYRVKHRVSPAIVYRFKQSFLTKKLVGMGWPPTVIKRTHCYISEFCSRERAFLRCISLTFDRCQVATRRLGSRPIAWVLEIRSSWPARPRTPTTNKPKRPKQGSKICFKKIYIYLIIIYRLVNIICNDDISNVNIYVKLLIVIMFHVLFYFEMLIFFFIGNEGEKKIKMQKYMCAEDWQRISCKSRGRPWGGGMSKQIQI